MTLLSAHMAFYRLIKSDAAQHMLGQKQQSLANIILNWFAPCTHPSTNYPAP